jgi:DNA polymerase alpha subunit A
VSPLAKKQRDDEKAKRDANDRDITEYFSKGGAKAQPKPKVGRYSADAGVVDMVTGPRS